jgi:hypothetical protein
MNTLQVAARFVAFTCYLNADSGPPRSPEAAGRFARENWRAFLPIVDRDLARFLTSDPPPDKIRHHGTSAAAKPATARAAG